MQKFSQDPQPPNSPETSTSKEKLVVQVSIDSSALKMQLANLEKEIKDKYIILQDLLTKWNGRSLTQVPVLIENIISWVQLLEKYTVCQRSINGEESKSQLAAEDYAEIFNSEKN